MSDSFISTLYMVNYISVNKILFINFANL